MELLNFVNRYKFNFCDIFCLLWDSLPNCYFQTDWVNLELIEPNMWNIYITIDLFKWQLGKGHYFSVFINPILSELVKIKLNSRLILCIKFSGPDIWETWVWRHIIIFDAFIHYLWENIYYFYMKRIFQR